MQHVEFNFKAPDYDKVFLHRMNTLALLRANPSRIEYFKEYYKTHIPQFIDDWGCTFDPRNADIGLPTMMPFCLFDKQIEWIDWVIDKWKNRQTGLVEKSRDMGMSWLSMATACSLCIFNEGISIGFGSRKQEYVDKIGDPKTLFWKARKFMERLPREFRGGYDAKRDSPHMRLLFPANGSSITGEAGDGIGRGDRKSIYFVDEAAYIERPELIEASLSNTTNCRIDISSARGMANPFAQKVHSGNFDVFTFHWRDDPRKDGEWYAKMQHDLDPVTLAQEVDINYSASIEGVVIPAEWVRAAIGAAAKLNLPITGAVLGALDVADEGRDLNAMAIRHGIELNYLKSWSGKGSDTLYTTEKAFQLADENLCDSIHYDTDGIGAFVRGDSRLINDRRNTQRVGRIDFIPFRGSGEVIGPEREMIKGRKNKDYFRNRKAQSWWALRLKFQNTFRAINGETEYDKDDLISINPTCPELGKLQMELSQPSYTINTTGKIEVDKAPDNMKSPNLADAVMMVYAPRRAAGLFTPLIKAA